MSKFNAQVVATPSPTPSPSSAELHIPKEVEEWLRSMSPGFFQNYKDIETTWNNPAVQFSMTLASDPQFRASASEIYAQPNAFQKVAVYEFGLIVVIWILRAWRLSKAPTWIKKLWVQLWVGTLFWVFSLFIIPYLIWGSTYKTALGQLLKAIIRHFF